MKSDSQLELAHDSKKTKDQIIFAYKNKVRDLKNEITLKKEEIASLQRTIKFTRIQELEAEIKTFEDESVRLSNLL